jgi:GntR family transcriptional regulator/MocR family aminotransferase
MVSDQTNIWGWDLHLDLDGGTGRRDSLEEALRSAIRSGRLAPGTRLPASRSLAGDLGVARGTVTGAYDQLTAEGWLVARQGSGTRVAAGPARLHPAPPPPVPPSEADRPLRYDFRPGRGDLSSFPRRAWVSALRLALRDAPDSVLDYGDPRGLPLLRAALASYVGRARGVRADPEHIVVCNGWGHALALVGEVMRDAGATRMAVEDPSMTRNSASLQRIGLRVRTVPVDAAGADPSVLAKGRPVQATVLTPAHQYPTGATLSADRRTEWIEWARARDAMLIEDDYDGEFRYDRQPVGALAALDPDRVVYVGTASKSLAPGLRLGWLVLPTRWLEPVISLRSIVDRHTGVLDQLALASMLESGGFDRHIRHARTRYRRRRDLLVGLLAERVPQVSPRGISAGLHSVVDLPLDGPDEDEVIAQLADRDVAVQGLSGYARDVGARASRALVIGFATPPEHGFVIAARALASALADVYR